MTATRTTEAPVTGVGIDIDGLPDWAGPVGEKGSHATEPASPRTRGRKGQSAPDPKKARGHDSSDEMARLLDGWASAILRGNRAGKDARGRDLGQAPVWIIGAMSDGWRDRLTEEDEALAGQHVARWHAVQQVVPSDRATSPAVLIDHVSEDDRPRPLDLGTTVSYRTKDSGELQTVAFRRRANRTTRQRIAIRDDSGRVVEVRWVEPREVGTRIMTKVATGDDVIPVRIGERVTLIVAGSPVWHRRVTTKVTRPPRERTSWVGNGPAVHGVEKSKTRKAGKARSKRAAADRVKVTKEETRDALASLLDSLQVGATVEHRGWTLARVASAPGKPRYDARPSWDVLDLSGVGVAAGTATAVVDRITGAKGQRVTKRAEENLSAAVADDI